MIAADLSSWRESRAKQIRLSLSLVGILIAGTLVAKFVYIFLPFVHYSFDWDPLDGDFLNVVHRIAAGLPIYSAWETGHVVNLYAPLIHYLVWAGWAAGFDAMRFARAVNLVAITSSTVGLFFLVRHIFNESVFKNAAGAFGVGAFMVNWSQFGKVSDFRPDCLVFLFSVLTVCSIVFNASPIVTAIVCTLAVFTKQSAVAVLASAVICFWLYDRKRLFLFCAVVSVLCGLAALALAAAGAGNVWRACFIDPNTYLVRAPHWRYMWGLFRDVCNGKSFWIYALASFGAYVSLTEKRRIGRICLAFAAADGAYLLRTAGSGAVIISYVWMNWFLCVVLGVEAIRFAARKLGATVTAVGLLSMFVIFDGKEFSRLLSAPATDLTRCIQTSQNHLLLIKDLAAEEGAWVAERNAVALVRSGKILDQEMCTFGVAASTNRGSEMAAKFAQELAEGRYRFYQRERMRTFLMPNEVDLVLAAKFRKVAESQVIQLEQARPVDILEFVSTPSARAPGLGNTPSQ
jgi:hypothetical protein